MGEHKMLGARPVGRLLRTLGFSPQKPERQARERAKEAIRGWVHETWARVKKAARRVKGHRYSPQLVSALGRTLNIKQQHRM